jgi:hypothetical protein
MIFIYKNLHNKMGRSWKEADAPPFNYFKAYFILYSQTVSYLQFLVRRYVFAWTDRVGIAQNFVRIDSLSAHLIQLYLGTKPEHSIFPTSLMSKQKW